jgi:hypothetical protein
MVRILPRDVTPPGGPDIGRHVVGERYRCVTVVVLVTQGEPPSVESPSAMVRKLPCRTGR